MSLCPKKSARKRMDFLDLPFVIFSCVPLHPLVDSDTINVAHLEQRHIEKKGFV